MTEPTQDQVESFAAREFLAKCAELQHQYPDSLQFAERVQKESAEKCHSDFDRKAYVLASIKSHLIRTLIVDVQVFSTLHVQFGVNEDQDKSVEAYTDAMHTLCEELAASIDAIAPLEGLRESIQERIAGNREFVAEAMEYAAEQREPRRSETPEGGESSDSPPSGSEP